MDATVRVWSWEQQFNCVHTVNAAGPVETLLVFDDWLFAGTSPANGRQGVVNVWHMVNGFEQTLEGHQGAIWCLAQGGAYLFSAGDDMGVKTWQFGETQRFEPVVNLAGHTAPIQCMTVAGNVLLSADRNGTVMMWDLQSGQSTATIATGHTDMLMALLVEEAYFVTAALDGHVKVWDQAGAQLFDQLVTDQSNQPSGIVALQLVSEGGKEGGEGGEQILVTACRDLALKMWRMPSFDKRGILPPRLGHKDVVRCLAKGPGNSFFSGSMDSSIIVWEFMDA